MEPQHWTLDELCDHAFDLFEELAADNLKEAELALYQQHYEASGFVDINEPGADWAEICNLDPELHVEAVVGIEEMDGQPERLLCRMLLSRDKEDTEVHALWAGVSS